MLIGSQRIERGCGLPCCPKEAMYCGGVFACNGDLWCLVGDKGGGFTECLENRRTGEGLLINPKTRCRLFTRRWAPSGHLAFPEDGDCGETALGDLGRDKGPLA